MAAANGLAGLPLLVEKESIMSTRRLQPFSAARGIAAILACALLAAPGLAAQQAPAGQPGAVAASRPASGTGAASQQSSTTAGAGQAAASSAAEPTPLELAQAQLAQAQAQLERAQAQLAQALTLAQQAQKAGLSQQPAAPAQLPQASHPETQASLGAPSVPAHPETQAALGVKAAPALQPVQARLSRLFGLGQPGSSAVVTQPEPSTAVPIAAAGRNQPSGPKKPEPFAFADFTWLNGNSRTSESPIDTKVFTGEFRVDVSYIQQFNHPSDNTLVGSSESGRTNEIQLQQLGIGGDFHYDNVIGRLMTQFGMYSTMTPRNDASPGRGQWNLDNAYRYLSEAYGGYHWDKWNGINFEAGIFMSYVGLFSYYNFDNWAYQPSYVSSNTPWFFNGLRVQIFPTDKLKIEPWFINGWQSYGKFNHKPGLGMQVLWRPTGSIEVLSNNYGVGTDTLGVPNRTRWHTDNSFELKYYDKPDHFVDKAAFSLTLDAGCESGGGVHCTRSAPGIPAQYFLGYMLYNRLWFLKDRFAVTVGGGQINNPGRYLVLLPPINGATAFTGTPYFTENPGNPFRAYDGSITFDYMPSQFVTFRAELDRRGASVPYFAGPGGVTPLGGNNGSPGTLIPNFNPDLRKTETRINYAVLVKF
jgi:Putative beta-barrel porin-2, OmpL-like. bbp2